MSSRHRSTIDSAAARATTGPAVTLRPLSTETDIEACLQLQQETWGADFRELVPPTILKIAQMVGGIVAGAFDPQGRLVGFVFGLTGVRDGCLAHWSHMLAVAEPLRNRGIGQLLKQFQRHELRAIGVDRMLWTYDPLVARNAHLNLNKLGARIVEYVEDMYGHDSASVMDSVIGSDRFVVEWDLVPPLPAETVARGAPADAAVVTLERIPTSPPEPLPRGRTVCVEVPADIQMLKLSRPEEARAWRALTRRAFLDYLGQGYVVRRLARDPESGRTFYVLANAAS